MKARLRMRCANDSKTYVYDTRQRHKRRRIRNASARTGHDVRNNKSIEKQLTSGNLQFLLANYVPLALGSQNRRNKKQNASLTKLKLCIRQSPMNTDERPEVRRNKFRQIFLFTVCSTPLPLRAQKIDSKSTKTDYMGKCFEQKWLGTEYRQTKNNHLFTIQKIITFLQSFFGIRPRSRVKGELKITR